MNLKSLLLVPVAAIVQLIFAASAFAQLIAYESFAGMPVGSGLVGSGVTATGWSDSGWAYGNNPRYQTVDPIPDLTYQIVGGALLDGSNRAVQLTTNPEPATGLLTSRTLPPQNTTIYFSFLVRPLTVGTGSDTLCLRPSNGTSSLGLVALQPDLGQQYFNLRLLLDGSSGTVGSSGSQALSPSTTYFIAGRISWLGESSVMVETWINPPAAYPGLGSQILNKSFSGPRQLSSIGLGISSSDTGGPTSTAIFDELRLGYTWTDVVLPTPTLAPLGNISTRLRVETGDNVLIGGFIVAGTEPKKVIVRAIGPSLSNAGVPGALANPILELHGPSGLITSNDNWMEAPNRQEIIDSTIAPTNDLESAILMTLPANNSAYTTIVRGVNDGTGVGLVEAYDLDRSVDSKLANISTRGLVQTGDDVMIGGFIIVGQASPRVIVRAIGPSLSVPGKLADPTLELHDVNGVLLAGDDNWRTGGQEAEIIATGIPPSDDLESAIVRTLNPGNYTAIVRGKNNATGVALVEVFALQ
ncbi:MAG TPA: hypothetical protein VF345_10270 [Chthoniobacterales bacterium]